MGGPADVSLSGQSGLPKEQKLETPLQPKYMFMPPDELHRLLKTEGAFPYNIDGIPYDGKDLTKVGPDEQPALAKAISTMVLNLSDPLQAQKYSKVKAKAMRGCVQIIEDTKTFNAGTYIVCLTYADLAYITVKK